MRLDAGDRHPRVGVGACWRDTAFPDVLDVRADGAGLARRGIADTARAVSHKSGNHKAGDRGERRYSGNRAEPGRVFVSSHHPPPHALEAALQKLNALCQWPTIIGIVSFIKKASAILATGLGSSLSWRGALISRATHVPKASPEMRRHFSISRDSFTDFDAVSHRACVVFSVSTRCTWWYPEASANFRTRLTI
jgi:hypothetical protein